MLRSIVRYWFSSFVVAIAFCLPSTAENVQLNGAYRATAYNVTGITASGEWTHRHVVAADPDLLPIGSRIKIRRAGRYSGEYVVADTGSKIQGRRLDIYMPGEKTCKKFGTRIVKVKVISVGNNTHEAAKQADQAVKADVAKDLNKNVVGNAATQEDWVKAQKQGAGQNGTANSTAVPNTSPKPAKP